MIVVGASKTSFNNGKRTKKHRKYGERSNRVIYFYDSFGKFHTKRAKTIEYLYYKYLVHHAKVLTCLTCKSKFIGYCPNCI